MFYAEDYDHDISNAMADHYAQKHELIEESLWWMTDREIGEAKKYHKLDYMSNEEIQAFAEKLRHQSSRLCPCNFDLGGFSVGGMFDLVSGDAYLVNDGRYMLAVDFPRQLTVRLKTKRFATHHVFNMFYGTDLDFKSRGYDLKYTICYMEQDGKLPEITRK